PPTSRPPSCTGSTRASPIPWRRRRDLRAPGVDRALEGPPRGATLEGAAQRAAVLLPAAALPLPVRPRSRPRAAGRGAALPALARLSPGRGPRPPGPASGRGREPLRG